MVASWLPDPPVGRSSDEISTISVPTVFIDSDTDDQELNVVDENVENGGYRLLNDHDNHLDDNQEESEDDTANFSSEPVQTIPSSLSLDHSVSSSSVLVAESAVTENAEARDINVDYEQVRAVMAHVTLPASATPSWASSIPDSEWCSFLQNRIRTLQGRDELDSEKH